MKLKNSVISILGFFTLFFSLSTNVFATVIDNDTNQKPYYVNIMYTTSAWQYIGNGYSGDSRILRNGAAGGYGWKVATQLTANPHYVSCNAYLNNWEFNDPSASYCYVVNNNGTAYTYVMAFKDQNNAPAGWSQLYANGSFIFQVPFDNYAVKSSQTPGRNTGADGFEFIVQSPQ